LKSLAEEEKNYRIFAKLRADMNGTNHTLALLLSMPVSLLKCLIMATVAYDLERNNSVKRAVEGAGQGAGVYMLSLKRDQSGRFLSRSEWGQYQRLVRQYGDDPDFAQTIDDRLELGNQALLSTGHEAHVNAIPLRMDPELDIEGTTRHHQAPISVGVSVTMELVPLFWRAMLTKALTCSTMTRGCRWEVHPPAELPPRSALRRLLGIGGVRSPK
jgi:hypothetical protein